MERAVGLGHGLSRSSLSSTLGNKKARRPSPGRRAVFWTGSAGSVSSTAPLGKVLTGQLRQVENHPCPQFADRRQVISGLPAPPRISSITAGSFSPGPQPRPMPPLAKAICRSTARTATKAAMASPTIQPGLQGRGSPASRPGAARDFTKPSSYGTLGAVKRQWPFWRSRQVSPERIPWLCCPAGCPGSWSGSPRRLA